MPLELTVLRCPDAVPPEARTVSGGDFTVGRGPGVDWILPDPERLLSKRHFVVAYRSGSWQLADTSTNGTFINADTTALGSGEIRTLRDGDRIRLGAYEIEARVSDDAQQYGGVQAGFGGAHRGGADPFADPFGMDPLAAPPPPPQPFGGVAPVGRDIPPILPDDFDLMAPDPIGGGTPFGGARPFQNAAQPDHSSVMEDAFQPPRAAGQMPLHTGGVIPGNDLLPDDWANDLLEGIGTPAATPAPTPMAAPLAPPPPPIMPAAMPPQARPVIEPSVFDSPAFEMPPPAAPVAPSMPAAPIAATPLRVAPPPPPPSAPPPRMEPVRPAPSPFDVSPFDEPSDEPQARLSGPAIAVTSAVRQDPLPAAPPPPSPPAAASIFDEPVAVPIRPAVMAPMAATPIGAPEAPARPAAPAVDASLLAEFLRGADVADDVVRDPAATMHRLGVAFRALVVGLREVLIARASVKSEFRIEQTVIQQRGNNPLKFALSDDDAMATLLGSGRRSDMTAAAAVADALKDIKLHELASMVAMQTAVRALLDTFEPSKLRAAAEQNGGMTVLPAQRKARAWDAFEAVHAQTVEALRDDFDSVFGKAFARAYERALDEVSAKERG